MSTLQINRSIPFVPSMLPYMGRGWKIIKQDERSLRCTEVNLENIVIDPKTATGKYLNGAYLDAGILITLLQNPHLVPDGWKKEVNGQEVIIFFKGTVLQLPDAKKEFESLYVLGMWWSNTMKSISHRYYYLEEFPHFSNIGQRLVEEIRGANMLVPEQS